MRHLHATKWRTSNHQKRFRICPLHICSKSASFLQAFVLHTAHNMCSIGRVPDQMIYGKKWCLVRSCHPTEGRKFVSLIKQRQKVLLENQTTCKCGCSKYLVKEIFRWPNRGSSNCILAEPLTVKWDLKQLLCLPGLAGLIVRLKHIVERSIHQKLKNLYWV